MKYLMLISGFKRNCLDGILSTGIKFLEIVNTKLVISNPLAYSDTLKFLADY